MATTSNRFVLVAALLCFPALSAAQPPDVALVDSQGAFPDASFEVTLRKYAGPANVYAPFYSWDALVRLDAMIVRSGRNAVELIGAIQSIGTENFGPRIGVGGVGYLVEISYARSYGADTTVSAGIIHVSSHLTRDLDERKDAEVALGNVVPRVADPGQYNVLFVKVGHTFRDWPFAPTIEAAFEPVNFRLTGGRLGDVRPIALATRSTLLRTPERSVILETHHELGKRPMNQVELRLDLFARDQPEGRLQIFMSASPGRSMHVSPHIGAIRDGLALGVRMKFRA